MKFRTVKIFTGEMFQVPERIQRLDFRATHGWQLRYGRRNTETEMFSDFSNDGTGAAAALELAIAALHKRIKKLPAPTSLRTQPIKSKSTDLPVGISGPVERMRKGRNVPYYSFLISVPLPTGGSTTKTVYIGTANTITPERVAKGRVKAIAIREDAVRKFTVEKTHAKRVDAAATFEPA